MSEYDDAFLGPGRLRGTSARIVATTRRGGVGEGRHATLGLGHGGHAEAAQVATNRARLRHALALPAEPVWLRQVHGCRCVELRGDDTADTIEADAAWTTTPGVVCAVLVADCLPIALADRSASVAAVAHAGWRGLAGGVLEATVAALPVEPGDLVAWLGPAIGPRAFEVGPEVRAAFVDHDPAAVDAFRPGAGDRWYADLYALARRRLHALGVRRVTGGEHCTFSDSRRFFSHRRDDGVTGRMATLAWLQPVSG